MREEISLEQARDGIIKTCSKCGVEKLRSKFNKNRSCRDGLSYNCKSCQILARKKSTQKKRAFGIYNIPREKVCPRCEEKKKIEKFSKDTTKLDCHTVYCKVCMQKRQRLDYAYNPVLFRERAKKYFLAKLGMNVSDYVKEEKIQNRVCAICKLPEVRECHGVPQRLAIDHNHNTMTFRGLLCAKCNTALGLFNVDNLGIQNLQRSIEYLKRNQG